MLDCLIIGGGPAGLTAAIYLGRYLRLVCVADTGESRAALIPESHNNPGFFGISGEVLLRRLKVQACSYRVKMLADEVTSLTPVGDHLKASFATNEVEARTVLLATGLVDKPPDLSGLSSALREVAGALLSHLRRVRGD
jgi:thioredoxin reductase (NADPH)